MKQINKRAEAKENGWKTYTPVKPCANGNHHERRTVDGKCLCEKCNEADKERQKLWRTKNHDVYLSSKKKYYENNKDAALDYQRRYREENLESVLETQRVYRETDVGHKERRMQRYQENPEKYGAYSKKWKAENPEAVREWRKRRSIEKPYENRLKVARRRAARQQRTPAWFSEFDRFVIEEAAILASLREKTTGIRWHIDHMIPLRAKKASGLHCGANMQVIPEYLNLTKHNKLWLTEPGEWIRHL